MRQPADPDEPKLVDAPADDCRRSSARKILHSLGPGIITGAADDDPSGIATYSVAGAQLGTAMLWTALLTWPLMAAVQMMCARIGMASGQGLGGAFRQKFPRPVLILAIVALLAANTINIGADLAGMADAAQMLSGFSSHFWVLAFAAAISWATVKLRYYQIASTLKWLALVLFAYIGTALVIHANWGEALRNTFIPQIPQGREGWAILVAILGTTISPYLFFWQASQEVEEERAAGRNSRVKRMGATMQELHVRTFDVGLGTLFSNIVMYFVIFTTAFTLHRNGMVNIQTSREAASALIPLAGKLAFTLYTVGIVGVGLLAIPTLTGSAAYAFAETFSWKQGLDKKLYQAKSFYGVILVSTLIAVALDFAKLNPVKALYFSAVINGLLAPFLLAGILMIACDSHIMNGQPSTMLSRVIVALTMVVMFGAGIMFIF